MPKKDKLLSFRTTSKNDKYLRSLMKKTNRSMAYLVSLMIDSFRERGIDDDRDIK